jgi:hypothetical protein
VLSERSVIDDDERLRRNSQTPGYRRDQGQSEQQAILSWNSVCYRREDADRKVGPQFLASILIPCVNFSRCGGLRGQAMTIAGAERRQTRLWLPIAYSIGLIAARGFGGPMTFRQARNSRPEGDAKSPRR